MINKIITIILIALSLFLINLTSVVLADWKLDYQGNLINISSQILGDEDNDEVDVENEEEIENELDDADNNSESREIDSEDLKDIKININEDNKLELEVETEDDETLESEQDEFEIENENDNETLKISTGEAENEFEIEKNNIKVKTSYPLRINPVTKELIMITPEGEKIITILPDDASTILNNLNLIDNPQIDTEIEIKINNNKLAYKFKGEKSEKLFGLFKINIEKEVEISAESGELLNINQNILSKILDALSF